jgi:hypothetical protein
VASEEPHVGDGCHNNFKTTGGWKRSELTSVAKRALDETGLMAATCFHGIGIRYLNIHRTEDRQTHGVALIENILDQLSDLKQLRPRITSINARCG